MPFYFALPRSGNSSAQRRRETGRVDYVRTAPTSLKYAIDAQKTRGAVFAENNLHLVALSVMAGKKTGEFDKFFNSAVGSRNLVNQVPNEIVPKMTFPRMSLQFKTLTDKQEERMMEIGLEERAVKGKGKIWVGSMTADEAKEVIEYGPNERYDAMGGTISIRTSRVNEKRKRDEGDGDEEQNSTKRPAVLKADIDFSAFM